MIGPVETENTELVSVIIPVYNVAEEFSEALNSLRAQTLQDFRVYLVDDGSTDGSGALCDAAAKEDLRFQVLHQKNAGAPAARNAALAVCSGAYVFFMDGDDFLEKNALELLVDCMRKTECEIAVCGYRIEYRHGNSPKADVKEVPCFDGFFSIPGQVPERLTTELLFPPWNKLYRNTFLKSQGLCFPTTYWDDTMFNISAFGKAKKIGFAKGYGYRYIKGRAGAETSKFRPDLFEKRLQELAALEDLVFVRWKDASECGKQFIADSHIRNIWGCLTAQFSVRSTFRHRKRELKKIAAHPSVKAFLPYVTPKAHLKRGIKLVLYSPFIFPIYLTAKGIAVVKKTWPNGFNQLKR